MSVFFTSRKTTFKRWLNTSSIPPRYLAAYRASSAFSYRIPNSFSIPGGSIENGFASSVASRHWVDRLSFCSWFCDTSSILQLLTTISQHLPQQVSHYLSTPTSVEIHYWHYLSSLCDPELISFDISLDTSLFSFLNLLISL